MTSSKGPSLTRFFENSDLTPDRARKITVDGLKGADYGEYYQEIYESESITKDKGNFSINLGNKGGGFGFRVGMEDRVGYAFSEKININELQEAVSKARQILPHTTSGSISVASADLAQSGRVSQSLYSTDNPLEGMDTQAKITAIDKIENHARSLDPSIVNVNLSYSSTYKDRLIITADGKSLTDRTPQTSLSIELSVKNEDGEIQIGRSLLGGRVTCSDIFNRATWEPAVEKALHLAKELHRAVDAPAGKMDIVLGPGWPAVLLHEAVGHGLESDFNRRGISVYSGQAGKQVAAPEVTIVEQGDIPGERGSMHFDDEGMPTQRNVLVENGVLKGYIHDRQNAQLMQEKPTGNGRRQSFRHLPMPRMTNTFFEAGKHNPEDIIKSVKDGLYISDMGGGQVDITSGKFNMNATLAYRIRDGKLCEPVKGASLVGDGLTVIKSITMVGNDLELERNAGVCGKEGQSVIVGCGQPTIRVSNMQVGGSDLSDGPQ